METLEASGAGFSGVSTSKKTIYDSSSISSDGGMGEVTIIK